MALAQQSNTLDPSLVPTLTCDTVIQTSPCAGGNVIVPFRVTGGNFNFGNVFTAQLSNAFGQFTTPVNIGSLTWISNGVIFATIPANTGFGVFYRIRIVASNPAVTSNPSPNTVIVTQVAQLNQIIATPHNYVCPGDTIMLTAINFANSYSWSTGATTQSIRVTAPGIYSVTTTDTFSCQSTARDTLNVSCTGIAETALQHAINVFPNPAADYITIQLLNENPVDADIRIVNLLGELILHTKLRISSEKSLNVSALNSGIYFLQVESEGQRFAKKIVMQ